MNRYRNVPGLRATSKASPSTLCQKCLKRDIYECKASAQERPYASRPSRTQQLANPKLMPKLNSETPDESSRTKGVADEQLAKLEAKRGRKSDMEDEELEPIRGRSRKRSRSASSYSSSSVSTISTNRSLSRSPRRKDNSPSPYRSRERKRKISESPPARSYSGSVSDSEASGATGRDRNTRRRRNSHSPAERGRHHDSGARGSWRRRTRSQSMDKSRIARERRSFSPGTLDTTTDGARNRRSHYREERDRHREPTRSSSRSPYREPRRNGAHDAMPPKRERSLSPFSKRLALTQAMNMGR